MIPQPRVYGKWGGAALFTGLNPRALERQSPAFAGEEKEGSAERGWEGGRAEEEGGTRRCALESEAEVQGCLRPRDT